MWNSYVYNYNLFIFFCYVGLYTFLFQEKSHEINNKNSIMKKYKKNPFCRYIFGSLSTQ